MEFDLRLEALSMYKVLDGLIHNINTPLNVVIGYSQQLKKQFPEIAYLESITDAGIHIDDLVQSCSRQLIQRISSDICTFDLKLWLDDEIKLLKNILEIKHALRLEANLPDKEVTVSSNPALLGLFVESLILQTRNSNITANGENLVRFNVTANNQRAELSIQLPKNAAVTMNLTEFLPALQQKLEQLFQVSVKDENLFAWEISNTQEVKILLPIAGKA